MPLLVLLFLAAWPAALPAQRNPLVPRSKGSPQAPVTVYEMSDFQCPFCRRHALETFPLIEREYLATGKVRWVFINFPIPTLHPNAVAAAEFAMCTAREGKFWETHDLLFRYQNAWGPLRDPGPFLMSLADSLNLGRPKLTTCLQTAATRDDVKGDAEGAIRAGATGTPSFWIEGGLMAGAQPIEVFRRILDSVYAAKTARP